MAAPRHGAGWIVAMVVALCGAASGGFAADNPPGDVAANAPTVDSGVAIVVGHVVAHAGEVVALDVRVEAPDSEVGGVAQEVLFAPGLSVVDDGAGRPQCAVGATLPAGCGVFVYLPMGCTPGDDCNGIRATLESACIGGPIPDGSQLYACDVAVAPTAAPGEYPVVITNEVVTDPDGTPIAADPRGGGVTVEAPTESTPTATAVETETPTATPVRTATSGGAPSTPTATPSPPPTRRGGGNGGCAVTPAAGGAGWALLAGLLIAAARPRRGGCRWRGAGPSTGLGTGRAEARPSR